MKKSEFEISELVNTFDDGKIDSIPCSRFFPYVIEILALRKLGVKHKIIAEMLNKKFKSDSPITNQYVSNMLSKWKSAGLLKGLDYEVEILAQSIRNQSAIKDLKKIYNVEAS